MILGHVETSLNLAWVLVCGFLVMFMQAGFAMVETGFTRSKNAVHTMAMNFVVYPLGIIGFWLVGYAVLAGGVSHWPSLGGADTEAHEVGLVLFGHTFGLFGASKFALANVSEDPASLATFVFSVVFMDTAATIPTGAMAERWKFSAFVVYALFMSAVLYPLYANWVWGGGWLATLGTSFGLGHGVVDFAGSSVVHMTGGVTALAGAWVIGPRIGKFRRDGTTALYPGHNLPMTVIGTFILAFGWFGFNAGSSLAASDARIALVAVNTMLASSAGALAALFYVWQKHKRPDLGMTCNGLLAGLVAVTASCAFVTPPAAVLIGAVAGLLVVGTVVAFEQKQWIDDPVGAVSVHGISGAWGMLALGLFANGSYGDGWNGVPGPVTGLLYGDAGQLVAQLLAIAVNLTFVFPASVLFFKLTHRLIGLRVSPDVEANGLDAFEMGSDAYPNT